jgi:hypothetical protein
MEEKVNGTKGKERKRSVSENLSANPNGRSHLGDLRVDGRIILDWISKE